MSPPSTERGGATPLRRMISVGASARAPLAVWAVAAYLFVVISRLSDDFHSLRLALVTAAVAGVLVLFDLKNAGPGILRRSDVRAALALFGLSALTIPFSAWPGQSFSFVLDTYAKVIFLFLVVVYTVRSVRSVKVLTWAILAALVSLEFGLLSWGTGIRPRITDTYDSNDLAFVMVLGIPLAAMWGLRARGLLRYAAAAIFGLGVLTIVSTRSRGGFVGLCAVVVLLIVRMPRRQRLGATALVIGCFVLIGMVGSSDYWDRIATIWSGQENVEDYDAQGLWGARWEEWTTGFGLMLRNPLLGVGVGAYDVAEGQSHGGVGKWSAAHNSFLQLGAELGIPGLLLFLFLLYRAIRNCMAVIQMAKREPRLETHAWLARGVEISLWGFIVSGVALSQAYAHFLYALIGLSIALVRQAAEIARSAAPTAEQREAAGSAVRPAVAHARWSFPRSAAMGRPAPEAGGPSAGRS